MYRISRLHGAPTRAKGYLNIALEGPTARLLAIAFAGRTALEVDNYVQASMVFQRLKHPTWVI
jgi:hypothetical protein